MNYDTAAGTDPAYLTERETLINTYVEAGTSDGAWTGDETTGVRNFTTQSAAEQYLAACTTMNAKYGRNVVSSSITDI
jgi:FlaG/FlaF family flagellin (archaellin)